MENSALKGRILKELRGLISQSCNGKQESEIDRQLHHLIVKKHYNAAEVAIDYHRKRIRMDVVVDDKLYNPRQVNLNLPTFRVNLLFKNLQEFLLTCIETDRKSMAFYAWLIRATSKKEVPLAVI